MGDINYDQEATAELKLQKENPDEQAARVAAKLARQKAADTAPVEEAPKGKAKK